jgi:hypothetical protein
MSLILLLYCEPILSCFCVNLDPVFFFACPPPGAECKKTNEYLSFGALIYSWYTTMYVDFIAFCPKQYCEFADHCFRFTYSSIGGGGYPSRHVPNPRTLISMKCLDASVLHVHCNADKNHLITSTDSMEYLPPFPPCDFELDIRSCFSYSNQKYRTSSET